MMELPVKLAAYLGLRRSEICGLRWENVDLEAGLLSIREVRTEVGGQRGAEVPQDPHLRPAAGHHRAPGPAAGAAAGVGGAAQRRPKEWVVLRQDGTPPSRTS